MLCQRQCIIGSSSVNHRVLAFAPCVRVCIFSAAFCKMQIEPLLHRFLRVLAVNGSFDSSLQRDGMEHFSQVNVAFQEGASLSRWNSFFPFTLITSSVGLYKSHAK